MMAIQKLGVAMPNTAKNLPAVSQMVSLFIADKIPRGTPTTTVRTKAAKAS